MNVRMLIILLISLWFPVDSANVTTNPDIACTQTELKNMDQAVARIISFGDTQRWFPDKKRLFPAYCRETKKDHAIVDSIGSECLKGRAKTYGKILSYSLGALLRGSCNRKNKKKRRLISLNKCMNNEKAKPIIRQQAEMYIETLRKGATAQPAENRIGYVCCYYFKLFNNIEKNLEGVCTEKQITTLTEVVGNLLQSVLDVACGDFTAESDACDQLPPPPAEKLNSVYPDAISFFVPAIELLANPDESADTETDSDGDD